MKLTDRIMQTRVCYGGKIVSLGEVCIDLLKIAPNQKCVDRYIQGLLLSYKRANKV